MLYTEILKKYIFIISLNKLKLFVFIEKLNHVHRIVAAEATYDTEICVHSCACVYVGVCLYIYNIYANL